MDTLVPWIVDALVVGGLLVVTPSVWDVVRHPAIGIRIHAAAKAILIGLLPLLLAAAVAGDGAMRGRAATVAAFLILTTPVSSHAIARAVWRREHPEEDDDDDQDDAGAEAAA